MVANVNQQGDIGQDVTPPCPLEEVNCFVDPCQFAECPAKPTAVCKSNYCGGCNAVFYDGVDIVEDCQNTNTSDDVRPVEESETSTSPCPGEEANCFVDPCQFAECPDKPTAMCKPNYCGGCNAVFYDGDDIVAECSN